MNEIRNLKACLAMTQEYKKYDDKAIREAKCLEKLYPAILDDIEHGDLFAGRRTTKHIIKFTPQAIYPVMEGYSVHIPYMKELMHKYPDMADEISAMIDFWKENCTFTVDKKYWENDVELHTYMDYKLDSVLAELGVESECTASACIVSDRTIRIAGLLIDYDKLVRLGITGLKEEILKFKEINEDKLFFNAMLIALDVVKDTCIFYKNMALDMAQILPDTDNYKNELHTMAVILENISVRPPNSFREAIQLAWIYSTVTDLMSYTRMDIWLGDSYVNDIDSGTILEDEAERLLLNLWELIYQTVASVDGRIFVGGKGRRNEENADRFVLLALEVTRKHMKIMPNFTMRFYEGQNPALMEKALKVIGEGVLYPMLYNDDVYVDGMVRMANLSVEDAEKYIPIGCGEMVFDHISISSPNTAIPVTKAIEAVLCNGRELVSDKIVGIETGEIDEFDTFEKFYDAFEKQLFHAAYIAAKSQKVEYEALNTHCAFLFGSILYDDCIKRGKALVDGGARYRGGCAEGFGFTNAGEAMYNISELVYIMKVFSLKQMKDMLLANFVGSEKERKMLINMPKYGNDNDDVDIMVKKVIDSCNKMFLDGGRKAGLDYYEISSVNPGGITVAKKAGASADGRCHGEPYAIGNSPAVSKDVNGITAMLSSIAKQDTNNGGYITNLKISRDMFDKHFEKTKSIIETYFKKGGQQLNITAVNRNDLENALIEPEKYRNLLVRVGGWSGVFVELPKELQDDVVKRTQY
jgi:pyruvate-formate lyase